MNWYWWVLLVVCGIIVIGLVVSYFSMQTREKWLTKWQVNDHIRITYDYFTEDAEVIKWDLTECEAKIISTTSVSKSKVGTTYYIPISNVSKNYSLIERERQKNMDTFMLEHSDKAIERDKKLEKLLS